MPSPHEVVLEVEPAILGPDTGPDRLIGHRQQARADAQARREVERHVGEPGAATQGLGPPDVGPEVTVPEPEPGRCAVAFEHRGRVPGLVTEPPAGRVVREPGERVHDRVEVGADREPVELEVVPGVDDDREVDGALVRPALPACRREREAVAHLRAAEAAGEHGHGRAWSVHAIVGPVRVSRPGARRRARHGGGSSRAPGVRKLRRSSAPSSRVPPRGSGAPSPRCPPRPAPGRPSALGPTLDRDPVVAFLDEEAVARVTAQVRRPRPFGARVHEDRVVDERVPDDRLVRRAIAPDRREHGEPPRTLEDLDEPSLPVARAPPLPRIHGTSRPPRRRAIPGGFYG